MIGQTSILVETANVLRHIYKTCSKSPHSIKEKLTRFKPKEFFFIDKGNFIIKTAENGDDVEKALRLRTRIYYEEMLGDKSAEMDFDHFDMVCDHLLVLQKDTGHCVGTYRLLPSRNTEHFYSSNEFNLSEFFKTPGNKLEIGRACISPEWRTGIVVLLLWKGLVNYVQKVSADYMFGCSSVPGNNPAALEELIQYLVINGHTIDHVKIDPRFRFRYRWRYSHLGNRFDLIKPHQDMPELLSPLLASYLKFGAKVGAIPAYDASFQCFDFFTVINMNKVSPAVIQRFCRA